MGEPAARLNDMHSCPQQDPGPIPHVGMMIKAGVSVDIHIGGENAARVGDLCQCDGPPDPVAKGSTGVYLNGKQAARMGDETGHGGKITGGCNTVLIGDTASGSESGDDDDPQAFSLQIAALARMAFCKIC